LRSKTTARTNM